MANASRSASHRGFLAPTSPFSKVTDPTGSHLMDPVTGKSLGGRPVGSKNQVTSEARNFALTIVRSPEYRKSLLDRVKTGTLPPNIEAMIWAYAYGRPTERVEVTHINPTAQLADLSIEQLQQRAEVISQVLKQVGDVEAAEAALAMMADADEKRRLEAIDGQIVDGTSLQGAALPVTPDPIDPQATLKALKATEADLTEEERKLRDELVALLAEKGA